MLDESDSGNVIDEAWMELGCRVNLGEDAVEFFRYSGPLPTQFSDRRRHRRVHFRNRAILEYGGSRFAVYTKDLSRSGIAFLHAEQLYPGDQLRLILARGPVVPLVVRRCLRVRERCYECGGEILFTPFDAETPVT